MRTFSEYLADRDIGLLIEYISLHENEPWYKRWGASAVRAAAPFVVAGGGLMGGGVHGQDVKPSSPASSEVKGGLVKAWDAANYKFVMVPFSDTERDTTTGLLVYKPKPKVDSPKIEPKVDNLKPQPDMSKKNNNEPVEKASNSEPDAERLGWFIKGIKRLYKDTFEFDNELADSFKDSKDELLKYRFMKAKNQDSFRTAKYDVRPIIEWIHNTFNRNSEGLDGKTFIKIVDLLQEHMPGTFKDSGEVDAALFYYSVEIAGGLLNSLNKNVSPEEAKIILNKIKPVKDIMLKFPDWSHLKKSRIDDLIKMSNN
jgi:hypothetical protein